MRKLQAIDDNTRYDSPAGLTKILRRMRDGEFGKVQSFALVIRHRSEGETKVRTFFNGSEDNLGNWAIMVKALEKDLLG